MVVAGVPFFCLFSYLVLLIVPCSSHPLCTDSRSPFTTKTPLSFCSYSGSVCCDSIEDSELQKQFLALNVTNAACGALLKSILCAKCDQFSSELYNGDSGPRRVPVLCNSTVSSNSTSSNSASTRFCAKVWDTCQNVSLLNSPFTSSLRSSPPVNSTSKLSDLWKSDTAFCDAYGGSSDNGSLCFDGEPVKLNEAETQESPKGLCFEKIGNGSYLNMVGHPDGSNRVFLSTQAGKIFLATVPEVGSGKSLDLDESNPFLDITDEVHFDAEFGLLGIAFHPDFTRNGRFFVSFSCDKAKSSQCSGRCSCNSDASCDPSKLSPDNGAQPCQYHSVIAEFTVNNTGSQPALATSANPSEIRRIFTMGLPFTGHHAGQILFGPSDGYMYFMMGDGGKSGDPYNFSQNKKSLLGKIMRLDIDKIPGEKEITDLGLWGNYSIPRDNPYSDDVDLLPEIWALGFRNPWRCSFDSERPSYFLCADVGQELYEEVDLVTKGGNYGWRVYEGNTLFHPSQSPGGNTSAISINPIFPVSGYKHTDVNNNEGSASITGGYFYRSRTDPCLYGRYLFADLFGKTIWTANENPVNSGNFTTSQIPFSCARDSPIKCDVLSGGSLRLEFVFSFGEDNRKDNFLLASSGVYRIVSPSRCGYACSKTVPNVPGPRPTSLSAPMSRSMSVLEMVLVLLFSLILFYEN
ncbi:hipl1 protein [Ranunculus cassubicifolius]